MRLDTLLKLYNDLTQINKEIPTIVLYDKSIGLIFRQLGKVISIPYFNNFYFPKTKLKLGVLTSTGYVDLMKNLQNLIEDTSIAEGSAGMVMGDYELKFYKCYSSAYLDGPQQFAEIKFITIKSAWLSRLYLRHSGLESKTLLKAILNERKSKSKKSIKKSSTS